MYHDMVRRQTCSFLGHKQKNKPNVVLFSYVNISLLRYFSVLSISFVLPYWNLERSIYVSIPTIF